MYTPTPPDCSITSVHLSLIYLPGIPIVDAAERNTATVCCTQTIYTTHKPECTNFRRTCTRYYPEPQPLKRTNRKTENRLQGLRCTTSATKKKTKRKKKEKKIQNIGSATSSVLYSNTYYHRSTTVVLVAGVVGTTKL